MSSMVFTITAHYLVPCFLYVFMLRALVLMCAGAAASAGGFFEPVENNNARPFYKVPLPPPVTVLYQPAPGRHHGFTPEDVPVPENKPIQQAPFPGYKTHMFTPSNDVPFPVFETPALKPSHFIPPPDFKSVNHVPFPAHNPPVFAPTDSVGFHDYETPAFSSSGNIPRPGYGAPTAPVPGFKSVKHVPFSVSSPPVFTPTESVGFHDYRAPAFPSFGSIPRPGYGEPTAPVPDFKSVNHVPFSVSNTPVFTPTDSVGFHDYGAPALPSSGNIPRPGYGAPPAPVPVFNTPAYKSSKQEVVAPTLYKPQPAAPQPTSLRVEQPATSFQSVSYTVNKQEYKKPDH